MIYYYIENRRLPMEHAVSLLKYNLFSSVKRVPAQSSNSEGIGITEIGARRVRLMRLNNVCKLVDSLNIDFKELKETIKWRSYHYLPSHQFYYNYMLPLYEKNLSAQKKDASVMIVKYLSWIDMHKDNALLHRDRVFLFALNVLFDAGVTERTVWKKLFLFAKYVNVGYAFSSVNPDRLEYVLRHIFSKNENNEDIFSKIYLETYILNGFVDHLKIILEYRARHCIEHSLKLVPIFFFEMTIQKIDDIPKNYPPQRLKLLILTTKVMWYLSQNYSAKEEMLQALKLYWKTTSHAYITLEEMNDIPRKLTGSWCFLFENPRRSFENKIQEACKVYQSIFNVCLHEPRSLKNYARIVARKYYSPEAIDELNYPSNLKCYIKLE